MCITTKNYFTGLLVEMKKKIVVKLYEVKLSKFHV
jgi:hypothetical protein